MAKAELARTSWRGPFTRRPRERRGSGQNTQHASLALMPSGDLTAAYASDSRSPQNLPQDPNHALHYNVFISKIPKTDARVKVEFADV